MLTPRQETILRKVVDSYAATGQPVASKTLAADPNFDCGPSTIRYELALLEAQGLLAPPEQRGPIAALDLTHVRRELDDALRVTTETLSEITNLLAVATAPAVDSATIRRIEVLTLQPSG